VLNRTRACDESDEGRGLRARSIKLCQKEAARGCGGRGSVEIECGEGGASRELRKAQEWQDCCVEDIDSGTRSV
jgi:hypothetical protein